MRTLTFSYTTRILHFLFALFILASYLLSDFPSLLWLHSALGIGAIFIVIVRIIWFFRAEDGAKLSSFDLNFYSLKNYLFKYRTFKTPKIRNPAASFAAFSMWTLAVLVGISGLIFIGAKYGSGLFGMFYFLEIDKHLVKEAHELFGNLLILIAGLHVLGVISEQIFKKTDIIKTMLDGKLAVENLKITPFGNSKFMALFVGSLTVLFVVYLGISKANPLFNSEIAHKDFKTLAPTMTSECIECHIFYPPNVTSFQTQMNILNNLQNHFKTDASLDDETLALLIDETKKLAPQKSPFRFEELANNQSITKTKRWEHEHKEFDEEWFIKNKVKKTDCKACHTNFEKGSINPFELSQKVPIIF